jgi:Coenzyme PQQ synthesis protein D (PqqD)
MVAKEQVSCDLAGEAAILNLQTGVYYGLDPVGARIWNLIQQPRTVSDVLQVFLKEYEVDSERCERDVFGPSSGTCLGGPDRGYVKSLFRFPAVQRSLHLRQCSW